MFWHLQPRGALTCSCLHVAASWLLDCVILRHACKGTRTPRSVCRCAGVRQSQVSNDVIIVPSSASAPAPRSVSLRAKLVKLTLLYLQACQAIIAALLVAIAVLSIISLVYRGDRWAVYWQNNPQGQQTYEFHAGWNTFGSTYSSGGYHGGNDLLVGPWAAPPSDFGCNNNGPWNCAFMPTAP